MTSRQRHLTTAASLLAGVLVLGVMAVIGYRQLTEPFGTKEPEAKAEGCPTGQHEVVTKVVKRGDVKVSVYNAGGVKGAAGRTMAALEKAGFRAGEVANAPSDIHVRKVKVYATDPDDARAALLARFFGKRVPVVDSDEEYGPGIDVFIGKQMGRFAKKAPRQMRLKDPVRSCVRDR